MSTKGQENERNKVSNNGFLPLTVLHALLNTEISQEGGSFKQSNFAHFSNPARVCEESEQGSLIGCQVNQLLPVVVTW